MPCDVEGHFSIYPSSRDTMITRDHVPIVISFCSEDCILFASHIKRMYHDDTTSSGFVSTFDYRVTYLRSDWRLEENLD